MEEKETRDGKKLDIKKVLFIPLVIIMVAIFVMMHWKSPSFDHGDAAIYTQNELSAPNFSFPSLEGKMVNLTDYKGKVVLVNIWATWCPPCIAEVPSLEKLYQTLKGEDFELLAISIDEDGEKSIVPFMKKYNMSFPVLLNPNGDIMPLYGATGVPETFIVRKNGIIASKKEGAMDWASPGVIEYLRNLIEE